MLQEIYIKNFALIKESRLNFKSGLTVITGETGAGKSILLSALGLILGERADLLAMGNPNEKCIVEAQFKLANSFSKLLEDNDLDFEEFTTVRRELLPNGKSRCFINDTPTTNRFLKQFGSRLIDIHGQRDTQLLLDPEYRLNMLDTLAQNQAIKEKYETQYHKLKQIKTELNQLKSNLNKGKEELDFMKFQFEELDRARLVSASELVELEERQQLFDKTEEIKTLCQQVLQLDEEPMNLTGTLGVVSRKSAGLQEQISSLGEMANLAAEMESNFSDLQQTASRVIESLDMDEEEMQRGNERLDLLNGLLNKHRKADLAELIAFRDTLKTKIDKVEFADEDLAALEKDFEATQVSLAKHAKALSDSRSKVAVVLAKEISAYLPLLNMQHASLAFEFSEAEEFTIAGKDEIEITAQLNKGAVWANIQRIASGGELSRIMLAFKTALSKKLDLPTLIFDEIDTGLGGETASKMGSLLLEVSKKGQVVSITHLAQVAAKGNHHLKVTKSSSSKETNTQILELETAERQEEIARMISGEQITPEALANAKVLLN